MITIDSCYNEAHDDLTFNVIGATMVYYNLTFNVIGATMGGPSQTPLLAYINQEFVAIKRNCLDGTPSRLIFSCSQRGLVGGQQAHLSLGPLGFAKGSSTASVSVERPPAEGQTGSK